MHSNNIFVNIKGDKTLILMAKSSTLCVIDDISKASVRFYACMTLI